jgi:hypothetical protein
LKKRLALNELSKRQGQPSGATGPAHWEKWVAALGQCGRRRRDEKENKKYRLTTGNLTKRPKGMYKKVSSIQNLIFK